MKTAMSISQTITLLCGLCFLPCANAATVTTQPITIDDPRPVAAAIEKLETIYAVPITYEDTIYPNEGERADVTEAISRTHNITRKVLVPKGGVPSFSYTPPPEDATLQVRMNMAQAAIIDLLSHYNQGRNSQMFTFLKTDSEFHVIAVQFVDEGGKIQKHSPLLDTPVTFTPLRPPTATIANAGGALAGLMEAVTNASNIKVWGGQVPLNLFAHSPGNITASNEPARSVLDRLIKQIPVSVPSQPGPDGGTVPVPATLSWQLFCDPEPTLGCALSPTWSTRLRWN